MGRPELLVTAFATGAAVLLIEILGTRIIGPVFGVSLFVWSALLAVTLGSLAVAYFAGGVWVDRRPTPRLLGQVVVLAGVLLGLVPVLTHGVLRWAEALGPRAGPLVSATILFAPALFALGMVGPIAVRLTVTDLGAAGHGVGAIYAVSTAGSLAATYVTGFVLIPAFETRQIALGAATFLILLGALSLAWRRRPLAFAALLVPALAWAKPPSSLRPASTSSTIVRVSTGCSKSSTIEAEVSDCFASTTRSSARNSRRITRAALRSFTCSRRFNS